MTKLVLLILINIGFVLAITQNQNQECPAGKRRFANCQHCFATCQHQLDDESGIIRACTHDCKYGCWCPRGQYEDKNGNCVSREGCLASEVSPRDPDQNQYVVNIPENAAVDNQYETCPVNEKIYDGCAPHCLSTCRAVKAAIKGENNIPCTLICYRNCWCKEGLYRDDNGNCVTQEQCLADDQIVPASVQLRSLSKNSNAQIPNYQLTCPSDQEAYPYGQCAPHCTRSCDILKAQAIGRLYPCTEICLSGCWCKEGLYKDDNGNCVTQEQCLAPLYSTVSDQNGQVVVPSRGGDVSTVQNQCPADKQYYGGCAPHCQNTCRVVRAPFTGESTPCTYICIRGCWCKEGLFEDDSGNCVTRDQCLSNVQTSVDGDQISYLVY